MKLLVVGAAGKTGSAVVEQALAAGHHVTAFVHSRTSYAPDPRVSVVEGDATDRAAIDPVMLGQDAVIDAIGAANPLKSTTLETGAAATIVAAMKSSGVRRIVVISMVGEGKSKANTNWWERIFLSTILRAEMKDKAGMEAIVDASGLDWVIVRPPFLRWFNDRQNTCRVRRHQRGRSQDHACRPRSLHGRPACQRRASSKGSDHRQ